jgi:hypothetical protein
MIVLELLWAVPLALLAWRAAVSGDAYWLRVAALGVIAIALLGAVLVSAIPVPGDYSPAFGLFIQLIAIAFAAIGSLYLLYWGAVTRDPHPHRLASIAGGALGLVPALYAIIFALTHTAAEPAR